MLQCWKRVTFTRGTGTNPMEKCTARTSFQTEEGKQNMTLICSCLSMDVQWEWPPIGVRTSCQGPATQRRRCFTDVMSLVTPFPVLAVAVVARMANKTGEQAELSLLELFPGRASHFLFLSLPLGQPQQPAQRDPPWLQYQVRVLVPKDLWVHLQRMLPKLWRVTSTALTSCTREMKKGTEQIKGLKELFSLKSKAN